MPAWTRLLCASALLAAGSARAVTVLVPEFVDDDPSEALKTRTTILKAAGAVQGLAIAPLSKFKKMAKSAHLDPKQLGNGPAAKILCHIGHLDGLLAGVVEDLDSKRTLHLLLYDRQGKVIFRRDADLNEGDLRQDQIDRISRGIAAALNLDDTPARKTVVAGGSGGSDADDADSDDSLVAHEPVKAKKKEPPPEINEEREEREADERAHPRRHRDSDPDAPPPKTPDAQAHLQRYEDPTFQIEVGAAGSVTSATLFNYGAIPQVVTSDLESGFYPGFVARLQSFPFHDFLNPLAGLGAIADFSYGQINVSTAGPGATTFSTTDLRFSGLLDYRFRLPILDGDAAIFSPSLGARIGLQLTDLNPPLNNPANVYPLDRTAFTLGGEVVEPFGHYVRLIAGGQYFFTPYPGSATDPNSIDVKLGAAQVFSTGFDIDAELQGHFGAPNASALTGALKFTYTQYADCFEQAAGEGCYYGNTQTSIDFWLLVGYAFY